jgi:hypothetical protein
LHTKSERATEQIKLSKSDLYDVHLQNGNGALHYLKTWQRPLEFKWWSSEAPSMCILQMEKVVSEFTQDKARFDLLSENILCFFLSIRAYPLKLFGKQIKDIFHRNFDF